MSLSLLSHSASRLVARRSGVKVTSMDPSRFSGWAGGRASRVLLWPLHTQSALAERQRAAASREQRRAWQASERAGGDAEAAAPASQPASRQPGARRYSWNLERGRCCCGTRGLGEFSGGKFCLECLRSLRLALRGDEQAGGGHIPDLPPSILAGLSCRQALIAGCPGETRRQATFGGGPPSPLGEQGPFPSFPSNAEATHQELPQPVALRSFTSGIS